MIALSVAAASCQEQPNAEAAPEPYSYGYETDTHAASEQRDPNGKVTGFYTLADADGRSRRVEYYADETGFHAKVQTNEVGTKGENPADVEVLAAPPNQEQLVYQAPAQAQAAPVAVSQQVVQPYRYGTVGAQYVQQPGYYGYSGSNYNYPGYGYYGNYGYGVAGTTGQRYGYGLASAGQYGYGVSTLGVGNFNNHLPSQYYRSVSSQVQPVGVAYGARYVTSGVPAGVGYSTVSGPSSVSYSSSVTQPAGGVRSSNYIVLKKRESEK